MLGDTANSVGYITAEDAAALTAELLGSPGSFSPEQLWEISGLAVAEVVYQLRSSPNASNEVLSPHAKPKILVLCGDHHQGGTGLLAARHLTGSGFECVVVYPHCNDSRDDRYQHLVRQCRNAGSLVSDCFAENTSNWQEYGIILDALSSTTVNREGDAVMERLLDFQNHNRGTVVSIDIPFAWDPEEGDAQETGFAPDVVVSLFAPKLCTRSFQGRHFLGGRFLPPALAQKYSLPMPVYHGTSQVVEITSKNAGESPTDNISTHAGLFENAQEREQMPAAVGWEAEYASYLSEQHQIQAATIANDGVSNKHVEAVSWEQEYQEYCIEKESRLAQRDAVARNVLQKGL